MAWLFLLVVVFAATKSNSNNETKYEATQQWITSTISMPRASDGMAIGTYDHSIYLLGGDYPCSNQLIRYDIPSHHMVDLGYHNLPFSVFGEGQFYSSSNNILYMISSPNKIISFDLRQAIFIHSHISIPNPVGPGACVAATSTHLYVLGGTNKPQVFSIQSNKWGPPLPSMLQFRVNLTCNIYQDTLYAIGGNNQSKHTLNTVEIFSVDPHAEGWKYLPTQLLYPTQQARSVVYYPQNVIFIIGGWYIQHGKQMQYINQTQIIDISTGKITAGSKLAEPIENTAAIIVSNITYAFGGFHNNPIKQWQYAKFIYPTNAPTNSPTNSPTRAPTRSPSRSPTHSPTHSPSKSPTRTPTRTPSRTPTHSPSDSPTHAPTHSPTKSPTNVTTRAPTNSPTNSPTHLPTKHAANTTASSSLLIPLLTIILIICAVLSFYGVYMCKNIDKDSQKNGGKYMNSKQNNSKSENMFKSLSNSIPISYASKSSSQNIDYMPMRTIDEQRELQKKEMHEYDTANNMMFEEQVYFKNRQKAKKIKQERNVAIFRPPR